jgi:DNA-binding NarL/FixJ family response regulator
MNRIGGVLDYRLLANLHRPSDPVALKLEVIRLSASGLKARDIAQALQLSWVAVEQMLREEQRAA